MALNVNEEVRKANTQGQAAGIRADHNTAQNNKDDFQSTFSIFNSPLKPGMVTNALLEKFTKEVEELKLANGFSLNFYCIDNTRETNFTFSAIVLAMTHGNSTVALPILVEASGQDINPVSETVDGRQIDIMLTTADAFDRIMNEKVRQLVSANHRDVTIIEGIIFPRESNYEDRNEVMKFILTAIAALASEFNLQNNNDIKISQVAQKMSVDMQFGRQQNNDTALPIRSDITTRLSLERQNRQQNEKFLVNTDASRSELLTRVGGYVDFIYAPNVMPPNNMMNPMLALASQRKCFIPNYIITSVRPQTMTPASVVLSILAALTAKNDNMWLNSFKSGFSSDDVGHLNVQGNFTGEPNGVGTPIDTSLAKFSSSDLNKLMQGLTHEDIMLSIDIDRYTETYSGLSFLESAAQGKTSAINVFINACDSLFNGMFSSMWVTGRPIFVMSTRMHRGYVQEANGAISDLRNYSCYLKVVELLGGKHIDTINDYNHTFNPGFNEMLRLATRKQIIDIATNGNAKYKGWTTRLTFSREVINTLLQCMEATGVRFRHNHSFNNEFVGSNMASYYAAAAFNGSVPFTQQNSNSWYGQYYQNQRFGN
jgi:hypothetical protein